MGDSDSRLGSPHRTCFVLRQAPSMSTEIMLLEPKAEASADLKHVILIRVLFTAAE